MYIKLWMGCVCVCVCVCVQSAGGQEPIREVCLAGEQHDKVYVFKKIMLVAVRSSFCLPHTLSCLAAESSHI